MSQTNIQPSNVTRPFQLLAAWLAGLILTNSSFLGAASLINEPKWAAGALVVASIANTPIFLSCLFLLLTKFRAEMQEDQYYTTHLERIFSLESRTMEYSSIITPKIDEQILPQEQINTPPTHSISVKEGASTLLSINDHIPNFDSVIQRIGDSGLQISQIFGKSTGAGPMPSDYVVSFTRGASISAIRSAVSLLADQPISGFAISKRKRNPPLIHIGAYSYGGSDTPFTPSNEALITRLTDENLTWTEIDQLLK